MVTHPSHIKTAIQQAVDSALTKKEQEHKKEIAKIEEKYKTAIEALQKKIHSLSHMKVETE